MSPEPVITKERLKALPTSSGVYLMKDSRGDVIYVGKAKNLRNRVRSYFNKGDGRYAVRFLRTMVHEIDTLVTEDERQALVLESDLIKKYKPRYNIRLKDDKAHLIVRCDMTHEWPRLELVRKVQDDGARYAGPFAFSYELRTMLEVIKRTLPLRTCSDRVINNRVRPCLEYQIKRCCGPCCLDVDHTQYLEWVDQAFQILNGKNEDVLKQLEDSMERASNEMRYEDAAAIRDRISVLRKVNKDRPTMSFTMGSRDAFALYRDGNNAEVSVLMVRQGRLFESRSFGFTDVAIADEDLLSSVLSQFYEGDSEVPEEVLLPFELDDAELREAMLTDKRGEQVSFVTPQRGPKARLLALASENVAENFQARFGALGNRDKALKALAAELELEEVPRTIECIDISHFQGGQTVASLVMFKDGHPDKSGYRHFNLAHQEKPDDFASMREVVLRHLSRAAEENTVCDLLIIDGGPGQLSQAMKQRKELGLLGPAMIGLAKKRTMSAPYKRYEGVVRKPERIYVEGKSAPVILNKDSDAIHLLERIRDEAHRFAITHHRQTRSKKMFRSELESIPGIGPKRRKDLLRIFGSVKSIREASAEEIVERAGLPQALAERVVAALQGDGS